MDDTKELQLLKQKRLVTLKNEIFYAVKTYNNCKKNNISFYTKDYFLKMMKDYKKQYLLLVK